MTARRPVYCEVGSARQAKPASCMRDTGNWVLRLWPVSKGNGVPRGLGPLLTIRNNLHSGLHNAARSSRYINIANSKGESTKPCRTPNSIVNSVDQEFPHLIQAKQPENIFNYFCYYITGWAVVLTCCISHSTKYRKKADFDPSGSQNPFTNFDKTWHGWLHSGPHPTWQLLWG